MNEQVKYDVIKKLVETNGNKQRASVTLGCTLRTVNRLIQRYKQEGKAAFQHGNRTRKPACMIPDSTRKEILCLYDAKYADANFRHFAQLLEENESIKVSDTFLRNLFFA